MANRALVPMNCLIALHKIEPGGHCYRIFSTFTHTDIRKRFFSVRCVPIWNSLPADVVCAHSLNKFKGLLEVHAHDRLFAYV